MSGLTQAANHFILSGANTHIVYDTQTPGPLTPGEDTSGGQLSYQGVEGEHTFRGKSLDVQESGLGTLISFVLKVDNDTGGLLFTLVLPHVSTSQGQGASFQALGIKTATRGFVVADGARESYAVFPLLGTTQMVETAL